MKHSTFIALICAAAVTVTAGSALARDRMSFDALDADGNGEITSDEMAQVRNARFAEADTNGDGMLDRAEMIAHAQKQASQRVDRMMQRMDANDDGALSLEEMTERMGRRGDMFARADTDASGGISRAEFDAMRDRMHKRFKGHQD